MTLSTMKLYYAISFMCIHFDFLFYSVITLHVCIPSWFTGSGVMAVFVSNLIIIIKRKHFKYELVY